MVANWSDADKAAVLKQGRLISKVCCVPGNASFTHPIVSGSENGAFGAHFDPRDVSTTKWVSLGYGTCVFPSHEHTVYLQPGDVLSFDAARWFHAKTVKPTVEDIAQRLRSEEFYAQQSQQAGSDQGTPPGREATSWGEDVGPMDGAEMRANRLAKAQQMYDDNTDWIDEATIALYFQS